MFTAFCYGCKQVVTSIDEKEFRRSGHVSTRDEAHDKYKLNTSRLQPDVRVATK